MTTRASMPSPVELRVVGLTYRPGYPQNILDLQGREGERVKLKRTKNKYDHSAVSVVFEAQRLGYLSRGMAKFMAPELDKGVKWRAWLFEVKVNEEYPDRPGLWITAERVG